MGPPESVVSGVRSVLESVPAPAQALDSLFQGGADVVAGFADLVAHLALPLAQATGHAAPLLAEGAVLLVFMGVCQWRA